MIKLKWSGFKGTYNKWDIFNLVGEKPGVYLIWEFLEGTKWECIYVGESTDVLNEMLGHLSDKEKNKCLKEKIQNSKCGFEYVAIEDAKDRKGVYQYVYDKYTPECVSVAPKGKAIEANLP
ncbi:MAG: hypothetical protein K9J13_15265 [Saprospiraceae bacterium]|nr:hypothetical protein [Saprospiraceae bacterium]